MKYEDAFYIIGNLPIPSDDKDYDIVSYQEAKALALDAISKQIPKEPKIKTTKEVPVTHNLGRLLYFYCPNCGKFIVGVYESDRKRGGGISRELNGCSNCLQAIDFSKWQKDVCDNK